MTRNKALAIAVVGCAALCHVASVLADGTAVPSLTSAETSECVRIATSGILPSLSTSKNRPTMYEAGIRVFTPGIRGAQRVEGGYGFAVLPDGSEAGTPDCRSIHRFDKQKLKMQSPRRHGAWIVLLKLGPNWTGNGIYKNAPDVGIGVSWQAASPLEPYWVFNRCRHGKWLKVREEHTLIARDIQTGRNLGSRKYVWPVKVRGSCGAAARSARLHREGKSDQARGPRSRH
jgi:hypothetical protein